MPNQLTLNKLVLQGANYIMINYFIVHLFVSDANKWVIDLFDMKVLPYPRNRIKTCDVCFLYFKLTNCVFKGTLFLCLWTHN